MNTNKILLFFAFIFTTFASAQVGIGTQNPQGIFNIDGAKNNATSGAPTAAQQNDDFVVTATGNLGLGTTAPTNRLHVNGASLFTPYATNTGTNGGGDQIAFEIYGKNNGSPDTQVGGLKFKWYNSIGGIEMIRPGASIGLGMAFNIASTGGVTSEAMRISNTGNVGIGTTAPTSRLTVGNGTGYEEIAVKAGGASNGGVRLSQSGTNGKEYLIYSTGTGGNGGAGNLDFFDESSNASRLFIKSGGNVGIGTTAPVSKLHVNSELAATNTINADASVLRLSRPTTPGVKWDNIAQFKLGSYALGGGASFESYSRMDLELNDGSNTTTNKVMTWQGNGNVGIGTTAPDRMLSVVQAGTGTAFVSNTSTNLMRFESTANSSSIGHYFKAKNAAGTVKDAVMGINPDINTNNGVFFLGLGNGDDLLGFDLVNYNSYVSTITGSKFGIGTKSPTEKLQVFGGNVEIGGTGTNSVANPMLRIHSNANTNGSGGLIEFNENSVDYGYTLRHNTGNGAYGNEGLWFETKVNNVYTPRFGFNDNGNVGIGTTAPGTKLEIKGGDDELLKITSSGATQRAGMYLSRNGSNTNELLLGVAGSSTQYIPAAVSGTGVIQSRVGDLMLDGFAFGGNDVVLQPNGGNVGIGTKDPTSKLHVIGGNITSTGAAGTNVFGTSAGRAIWMSSNNNSADKVLAINMQNNIINSKYIGFENAGGGDIGSITMATTTSIAFNTTSDERLKENIRNTSMGINDLMKIKVADYVYKSDKNLPQTGFIAQQLHTVFPNAVTVGGEDVTKNPWAVDYGKVTPLIVKATQDLKNEVETLKKEIEMLKALIQKSK